MSCEDEHYHPHSHSHSHSHGDEDEDDHSHGHSHSHSHGHSHIAPIATNASQSLLPRIDLSKVTGLNLSNPPCELSQIFRTQDLKYHLKPIIKSDDNHELIIHIPFLDGSTKLFSIILRTNGDLYCPKMIKLYKNDKTIDFSEIENKKPTFVINHPHLGVMYNDDETSQDIMPEKLESDDDFVEHLLPRHLFTGVHHLTIYIASKYKQNDEQEEEEEDDSEPDSDDEDGASHLHYIELRGEFTSLNKNPVVTLYESAANPNDHKLKSDNLLTNNFTIG
ncbi:PITH domain-containing protein [Scheffersomyces coipomensis]|uniref:PITH domain-containing protein n=1 Tax=Scheffersomyces coipomensis TaxID=1788519 RepID=UPI00315CC374